MNISEDCDFTLETFQMRLEHDTHTHTHNPGSLFQPQLFHVFRERDCGV